MGGCVYVAFILLRYLPSSTVTQSLTCAKRTTARERCGRISHKDVFHVGVISTSLSDGVYEETCAMVLLKAVLVITKDIGDDADIDV